MAKKSFVLSNGDGRVTFSNTGSNGVFLEDTIPGHVTASNLYINNYRITSFANNITGTLLSSSGGSSFITSSVTGTVILTGALGWNGTSSVATNLIAQDYSGMVDNLLADLSGNYKEYTYVIGVGNVTSGTLKPIYGGTGLSGSQYIASKNLILKGSGSSPVSFTILSASASGTIITSGENRFDILFPSYKPDIRFYTTSSSPSIWYRPIGANFARIIMVGGGGGGGGGTQSSTTWRGGGGGGSGGFTDITIDLFNIISASIVVGAGGAGGAAGANIGSTGGTTSFTDNNGKKFSSGGGAGGTVNNSNAGASGGSGLNKDGYSGASSSGAAIAQAGGGISTGGGKGAGVSSPATSGGIYSELTLNSLLNFEYSFDTTGKNLTNIKVGTGTAGSNTNGISPSKSSLYGAGGGGGVGSATVGQNSAGGPGGDGFALIISW